MRIFTGGLPALLLVLGASVAEAQPIGDVARLRAGAFLYAAPKLLEPNFSKSVVVLVRHEPQGSMGLIVNRATAVKADEALPNLKPLRRLGLLVYVGGPVQPEAVFALVRSARPPQGASKVVEDVYLTGRREDLESAAKGQDAPSRVRIYLGYAGWSAGQLEAEVRRGDWLVTRGEAAAIFTRDPDALWPKVYLLLQRREVRLAGP